jgi:hypothetical protein
MKTIKQVHRNGSLQNLHLFEKVFAAFSNFFVQFRQKQLPLLLRHNNSDQSEHFMTIFGNNQKLVLIKTRTKIFHCLHLSFCRETSDKITPILL